MRPALSVSTRPTYSGVPNPDGVTRFIAQKTVVIPAADGLYVLQLNLDGLEAAEDALGAATDKIDSDTTIGLTPEPAP